jgi:hypothetical protein
MEPKVSLALSRELVTGTCPSPVESNPYNNTCFFQIHLNIDLKGFWRCCMLYRIHRIFLDFFHRPVFQKNTTFRKLDLFPSSGEGGQKTPTQLGPSERANLNHWVGVFSPSSPEEGNRSSFRNVVFFGILDDGKSPEKFCEFCATYTIVRILSSLYVPPSLN